MILKVGRGTCPLWKAASDAPVFSSTGVLVCPKTGREKRVSRRVDGFVL